MSTRQPSSSARAAGWRCARGGRERGEARRRGACREGALSRRGCLRGEGGHSRQSAPHLEQPAQPNFGVVLQRGRGGWEPWLPPVQGRGARGTAPVGGSTARSGRPCRARRHAATPPARSGHAPAGGRQAPGGACPAGGPACLVCTDWHAHSQAGLGGVQPQRGVQHVGARTWRGTYAYLRWSEAEVAQVQKFSSTTTPSRKATAHANLRQRARMQRSWVLRPEPWNGPHAPGLGTGCLVTAAGGWRRQRCKPLRRQRGPGSGGWMPV